MAYQEELQQLVGAKESMRQSIIAKGVDVPESAKIEEYPEYIAQITGDSSIPDLSKVLTKDDFEIIQNIIDAGKAREKFKLGDEFLVSYGSYTMPFEVVGFEDVEVEGGETKLAINLLAKYTSETASAWAINGSTTYSASVLRARVTTTYQNKLNSDFVACLADTKTQTYSRDGTTDIVYDKLFAPSTAQLGATGDDYHEEIEGPVFTAYQGVEDIKRAKSAVDGDGTPVLYWSRTLSNFDKYCHNIAPSGRFGNSADGNTLPIVVACNFIGGIS